MSARNERQLMRQRGAGSRNPSNVDFGFNFGAHGSREERQLMRQRGAGNRKIDNIDFGFSFPTPNQSRRSSLRTPRSVASISNPPRQRRSSVPRSADQSSSEQRRSQTPQPAQIDSHSSAKRRKIAPEQVHAFPPSGQRRRSSRRSFQIAEEKENHLNTLPDANAPSPVLESPLFFPEDDGADKENENASSVKDPDGKSVLANSNIKRRITRSSLDTYTEPTLSLAENEESTYFRQAETLHGPAKSVAQIELENVPPIPQASNSSSDPRSSTEAVTFTEKPSKKKKKRKSVVLGPRRRRSSGNQSKARQPSEDVADDTETLELTEKDISEHTGEETAELTEESELFRAEEEAYIGLAQPGPSQLSEKNKVDKHRQDRENRRKNRSALPSPEPQAVDNMDEDETYIDEEHSPEPPTPAPRRKTKPRVRQGSHDGVTKTRNKKGASFPILTHRMTNTEALPTIMEEEDEHMNVSGDVEEIVHFQSAGMFSDRTAPNAVDVLAQICRETIETAIENLSSSGQTTISRAEIKRKRTALEAFGQDLDHRLFEMSEAVENRLNLEARLRRVRRQKAELQAQWLEIRRQRDMLALKADSIRRHNWESEEESKKRWEISDLAQRLELDVELEGQQQDTEAEEENEGLEFMLRSIGGLVSKRSSDGGLLERIKSFNRQLEMIAVGLEGR